MAATGFIITFNAADGNSRAVLNSVEQGIYMTNRPDIIFPELQVDHIEVLG